NEEIKRGKMERLEPAAEYKEVELIPSDLHKTTWIGSQMIKEMEMLTIDFLKKNNDMFARCPSDFKGIDPEVIMHRPNIDPQIKPVKQKKRMFGVERNRITDEEVNKLLQAGFVREIQYTTWLSNVVIIPKAAGKWRMCTDFTDLNKSCPKDHYPMPRIDLLVDSTAGCALFSMMDACQGYHQIFMELEDSGKTAFVTEKGVYCYKVIPFDLKNAGATFNRLVNKMFKDQIGSTMEVYVDAMLVKSKKENDHLAHLGAAFDIMQSYGMKDGKFLGYKVSERGIGANLKKYEQLGNWARQGKVALLNQLIARSADRNLPFLKVLRKVKDFEWNEECEKALQELKTYLATSPLLVNPLVGERLYVYLAVSDEVVSSVLVREEEVKQSPIYYVSKMLQGTEKKYIQIEKLALALVTTARKLRPCFQSHPIVVMSKLDTSGRMVKWAVELREFDIEFQTKSTIKAHVFADFLVEVAGEQRVEDERWLLHVDGSSNSKNEYEALIQGLQTALDGGVKQLDVYTDLQLVTMQVQGSYETREWTMTQYLTKYLNDGTLPSDPIAARRLQLKANRFMMLGEELYKRTPEGILLKCLDDEKAQSVMREVHEESCGLESRGSWCRIMGRNFKARRSWLGARNSRSNKISHQWEILKLMVRTTPRTAIGEDPFCLVYESETIIPAEIREETTRVSQYDQQEKAQGKSFDLSVIEEERDRAYAKILRYKSMMTRSYN
ncbi:UNVERIFIED_CONTAM: Retrovirus-related Pol polyprotein from transposon, partial [Sesamum indicum]